MKQADRERLLAALMRGLKPSETLVHRVLEQMATEDVDVLEPILDEIIARECQVAVARSVIGRGSTRMLQSSPRRERPEIILPLYEKPRGQRRKAGA